MTQLFGVAASGRMDVSNLSVSEVNHAMSFVKSRGGEAWIEGDHQRGFFMCIRTGVKVYGGNVSEGTDG